MSTMSPARVARTRKELAPHDCTRTVSPSPRHLTPSVRTSYGLIVDTWRSRWIEVCAFMVVVLAGWIRQFRPMILDLGPEGRRKGAWTWRDPSLWDEDLGGGAARRAARTS